MNIELVAKTVQVLSVVAGVVFSVLSFNDARDKEMRTRTLEAAKPFLDLRQKLYTEAIKTAAVLANPEDRSQEELLAAKRRFRELYVVELSMVEEKAVEQAMVDFAKVVDPQLVHLNNAQSAAYVLSHVFGNSFQRAGNWRYEAAPGAAEPK